MLVCSLAQRVRSFLGTTTASSDRASLQRFSDATTTPRLKNHWTVLAIRYERCSG